MHCVAVRLAWLEQGEETPYPKKAKTAVTMTDDGILGRIQEPQLQACNFAKPGPKALAKRFFARELRTGCHIFYGAAASYADLLGESSPPDYRKLAETEWVKVPSLELGTNDPTKYTKRLRITHIMETLGGRPKMPKRSSRSRSETFSSPCAYLQIWRRTKRHASTALRHSWQREA